MDRYKVVVDKSTVPVGTADKVRAIIRTKTTHEFDVVSNPEFLKQGKAIADFMQPDRVVIGSDSERALKVMEDLYEPFLRTFHPLIAIDVKSAEMAKYAANCFLATKISFINEMSNLCEKAGLTFRRCERPSELTSASAMIFCSRDRLRWLLLAERRSGASTYRQPLRVGDTLAARSRACQQPAEGGSRIENHHPIRRRTSKHGSAWFANCALGSQL